MGGAMVIGQLKEASKRSTQTQKPRERDQTTECTGRHTTAKGPPVNPDQPRRRTRLLRRVPENVRILFAVSIVVVVTSRGVSAPAATAEDFFLVLGRSGENVLDGGVSRSGGGGDVSPNGVVVIAVFALVVVFVFLSVDGDGRALSIRQGQVQERQVAVVLTVGKQFAAVARQHFVCGEGKSMKNFFLK